MLTLVFELGGSRVYAALALAPAPATAQISSSPHFKECVMPPTNQTTEANAQGLMQKFRACRPSAWRRLWTLWSSSLPACSVLRLRNA